MKILARFPARPSALPDVHPTRESVAPAGRQSFRKPRPASRAHPAVTRVPNRSLVILALIALGVWGMVLRDEIMRGKGASIEVAEAASRPAHHLAVNPGPTAPAEARISE